MICSNTSLALLVAAAMWAQPACALPNEVSKDVQGTAILAAGKPSSKSQTTTAPRPGSAAPLTAQECAGLGGTVIKEVICVFGGGQACSTVDQDGVVRTKCLSRK